MRATNCLVTAALALAVAATALTDPPPRPREGALKIGDAAPGLTLDDLHGKSTVKLADLRGKPVVLIFGSCT
jgi:hypothetical protein